MAGCINDVLPDGLLRQQSANIISLAGATFVIAGAAADTNGYRRVGTTLRCVGEAADDIDGDWARRFGVANKTGALVDATLDKVKIAAEVWTLWRHTETMPPDEASTRKRRVAFVASKHAINAALNSYIALRGEDADSSFAGKANMWADGIFFGGAAVADTAQSPRIKAAGNLISDIGFVSGMVTGAAAIAGYSRRALGAGQSNSL